MSQENLQRVREQYARYNAGERAPGRWFWHEDAEYHTAREDPDHAVHRGIDGIGKLFASWLEAYPDLRLEIQQAEARGDGNNIELSTTTVTSDATARGRSAPGKL
jgi:SnoaL-like domain